MTGTTTRTHHHLPHTPRLLPADDTGDVDQHPRRPRKPERERAAAALREALDSWPPRRPRHRRATDLRPERSHPWTAIAEPPGHGPFPHGGARGKGSAVVGADDPRAAEAAA